MGNTCQPVMQLRPPTVAEAAEFYKVDPADILAIHAPTGELISVVVRDIHGTRHHRWPSADLYRMLDHRQLIGFEYRFTHGEIITLPVLRAGLSNVQESVALLQTMLDSAKAISIRARWGELPQVVITERDGQQKRGVVLIRNGQSQFFERSDACAC